MRPDFDLTTAARIGGGTIKKCDDFRREVGSCRIFLIVAEAHGCGLTSLLSQVAGRQGYPFVTIHSSPTEQSILEDVYTGVFRETSVYWGGRRANFHQIVSRLREDGAPPLLIDGDRLTEKTLDVVMDIGDSSGSPLVLGGVGRLRALLGVTGRGRELRLSPKSSITQAVSDRVVVKAELPTPSIADARLLATEIVEVGIEDDLIRDIHKQKGGSLRSLLTAFQEIESAAFASELKRIGLAQWREQTGATARLEAPKSRSLVRMAREPNSQAGAA